MHWATCVLRHCQTSSEFASIHSANRGHIMSHHVMSYHVISRHITWQDANEKNEALPLLISQALQIWEASAGGHSSRIAHWLYQSRSKQQCTLIQMVVHHQVLRHIWICCCSWCVDPDAASPSAAASSSLIRASGPRSGCSCSNALNSNSFFLKASEGGAASAAARSGCLSVCSAFCCRWRCWL